MDDATLRIVYKIDDELEAFGDLYDWNSAYEWQLFQHGLVFDPLSDCDCELLDYHGEQLPHHPACGYRPASQVGKE